MADFNRVIMIGNLTRDPEYKQLPSGQALCRLGLASNRQFKNRQTGNMIQEVCFIDVDVWGAQAESCHQYLQKGRQVLVEGRIKFDSWEDQEGQRRSKHAIVADRVVFLSASQSSDDSSKEVEHVGPKNAMEKELMEQLNQIKEKANKVKDDDSSVENIQPSEEKTGAKKRSSMTARESSKNSDILQDLDEESSNKKTGEINFKDEPPFEDDLPF